MNFIEEFIKNADTKQIDKSIYAEIADSFYSATGEYVSPEYIKEIVHMPSFTQSLTSDQNTDQTNNSFAAINVKIILGFDRIAHVNVDCSISKMCETLVNDSKQNSTLDAIKGAMDAAYEKIKNDFCSRAKNEGEPNEDSL